MLACWQCTRVVAQRAPGLLPTWNGRSNGAWLSYLKAIWPEWNEKQESINSLGVQFAPWAEALKRTNHVGSGHWKMNCERPGLACSGLACPGVVQCGGAAWRVHVWVRNSSFKPSHLHLPLSTPCHSSRRVEVLGLFLPPPPRHLSPATFQLLPPLPSLSTDINHLLAHWVHSLSKHLLYWASLGAAEWMLAKDQSKNLVNKPQFLLVVWLHLPSCQWVPVQLRNVHQLPNNINYCMAYDIGPWGCILVYETGFMHTLFSHPLHEMTFALAQAIHRRSSFVPTEKKFYRKCLTPLNVYVLDQRHQFNR